MADNFDQSVHGPQTNIAGDVDGSVYSGHADQIGNRTIHAGSYYEHDDRSDRELLQDIHDLLLGNPRKGRPKGLVQTVEELKTFNRWVIIGAVAILVILIYLIFADPIPALAIIALLWTSGGLQ